MPLSHRARQNHPFDPTKLPGLELYLDASRIEGAVLAKDGFSRPDAADLGTSTSNHTWTNTAGTWGIVSGKAKPLTLTSSRAMALLNAAATNLTLSTSTSPGLGGTSGIIFRSNAAGTVYLQAQLNQPNNTVDLYSMNNGSETLLDSVMVAVATNAPSLLSVTATDRSISISVNGTVRLTELLSTADNTTYSASTNTYAGLYAYGSTNPTFDEFQATMSGTIADATPIGLWPDLSGKGRHAVQSDTSKRPLLRSGPSQNLLPYGVATASDPTLFTGSNAQIDASTEQSLHGGNSIMLSHLNRVPNSDFETDAAGWSAGDPIYGAITRKTSLDWASTNLLTYNQATFEVDASGWQNVSGASIARSTGQAYHGVASLAVTSTDGTFMQCGTDGLMTNITAGRVYAATVRTRAATSTKFIAVQARYADANGLLSTGTTSTTGTTVTNATSGWTESTLIFVPPSAATRVALRVQFGTPVTGEVHYLDAIGLYDVTPQWSLGGIGGNLLTAQFSSAEIDSTTLGGNNSTRTVDSIRATHGSKAHKVNWIGWGPDLNTNASVGISGRSAGQWIVQMGRFYVPGGSADIRLQYWSGSAQVATSSAFATKDTWFQATAVYQIPAGQTNAYFGFSPGSTAGGDVWVDELGLFEITIPPWTPPTGGTTNAFALNSQAGLATTHSARTTLTSLDAGATYTSSAYIFPPKDGDYSISLPSAPTPTTESGPGRRYTRVRNGAGVLVEEGTVNLVLNPSFEQSLAGGTTWTARGISGSLVTTDTSQAFSGTQSCKIQMPAGSLQLDWGVASAPVLVSAGNYTMSAYMKAPTGTLIYARLFWRNAAGTLQYPAWADTIATGDWQRITRTYALPSEAVSAFVVCGSPVSGVPIYADAVQLEKKPYATTFTEGSLGTGYSYDTTTNLIANSSFETDTTGWEGLNKNLLTENQSSFETSTIGWLNATNGNIQRTTTIALTGTSSLALTSAAPGDAIATTPYPAVGSAIAVIPGQVYTLSASARAATTTRTIRVGIRWGSASNGGYLGEVNADGVDSRQGWTQVTVVGQAPAGAVWATIVVRALNCSNGETHYFDAVTLMETPHGNLVSNPDFEDGIYSWAPDTGSPTLSHRSDGGYAGASYLRAIGSSSTTDCAVFMNPGPTVLAGSTYTISAYVRPSYTASLRIDANSGSGGVAGTNVSAPANIWTRVTFTYTRALAGNGLFYIHALGAVTPTSMVDIDAVQVVVGSSALTYLPPRTRNLLTNPSFETTVSPWTNAIRSITQKSTGAASLSITAAGTAGLFTVGERIAATPGRTYTFQAKLYNSSRTGAVRINWKPSDGMAAVISTVVSASTTLPSGWTTISVTGIAPTNAYLLEPQVEWGTGTAGDIVYVDDVQIEEGSYASPFVAGDLGAGYSWDSSQNLISNPDFETNTTGWNPADHSNGAVARLVTTNLGYYKYTPNFQGGGVTITADGTYLSSPVFKVAIAHTVADCGIQSIAHTGQIFTGGEQVTVSIYVRGTGYVYLQLRQGDAAGSFIQGSTNAPTTLTDAWQRFTITATLHPSARDLGLKVLTQGTQSTNPTFWVAAPQIELGATATTYNYSKAQSGNAVLTAPQGSRTAISALTPSNKYALSAYIFPGNSGTYNISAPSTPTPSTESGPGRRYGLAKNGAGALVEEGTVNLFTNPLFTSQAGAFTSVSSPGFIGSNVGQLIKVTSGPIYPNIGPIPAAANTVYTFSIYVRVDQATQVSALIRWDNSSTISLATSAGTTVTLQPHVWARLIVTGTSHAQASIALPFIALTGSETNVQTRVSAAQVEKKSYATTFTDGGLGTGYSYTSTTNLVSNPSVETDLTGWSTINAGTSPTIERSTERAFHGTASVKFSYGSGAATDAGPRYLGFNLIANQTYTASVYVYVPATVSTSGIRLCSYGAAVNNSTTRGEPTTTVGSWVRLTHTFTTIFAGDVWLFIGNTGGTTAGGIIFADALQLEQRDFVTPFGLSAHGGVAEYPSERAGCALEWQPAGLAAAIATSHTVGAFHRMTRASSVGNAGFTGLVNGDGTQRTQVGISSNTLSGRILTSGGNWVTPNVAVSYAAGDVLYIATTLTAAGVFTIYCSINGATPITTSVSGVTGTNNSYRVQATNNFNAGSSNSTAECITVHNATLSATEIEAVASGAILPSTIANRADCVFSAFINDPITPQALSAGSWQRITTLTTQDKNNSADLVILPTQSPGESNPTYIDAVKVEEGHTVTPYSQTGAAQQSTSLRQSPWVPGGSSVENVSRATWNWQHGTASLFVLLNPGWRLGSPYGMTSLPITVSANSTYTLSAFVAGYGGIRKLQVVSATTREVLATNVVTGQWGTRYAITFSTGTHTSIQVQYFSENGDVYLDTVQLEQRDYATPFGVGIHGGVAGYPSARVEAQNGWAIPSTGINGATVIGWVKIIRLPYTDTAGRQFITVGRIIPATGRTLYPLIEEFSGTYRVIASDDTRSSGVINLSGLAIGDVIFMAATSDGTSIRSYGKRNNETFASSTAVTTNVGAIGGASVRIGHYAPLVNRNLNTTITENFMVFNTVLSVTEIQAIADGTILPSAAANRADCVFSAFVNDPTTHQSLTAGSWQRITSSQTRDKNTQSDLVILGQAVGSSTPYYIDAVQVERKSSVSTYAPSVTNLRGHNSTTQMAPVVAGRVYSMQLSARSFLNNRPMGIEVQWRTSAGSYISASTVNSSTSVTNTGWTALNGVVIPPSNAAFAVIVPAAWNASLADKYWVDQLQVADVTPASWTPGATGGNLYDLDSSNLEASIGGWTTPSPDYTVERTLDQAYSGQASLRLNARTAGSGNRQARGPGVSLTQGKVYYGTARVKAQAGQTIHFFITKYSGVGGYNGGVTATGEWQKVEASFLQSDATAGYRLQVEVGGSDPVYVDEAAIYEMATSPTWLPSFGALGDKKLLQFDGVNDAMVTVDTGAFTPRTIYMVDALESLGKEITNDIVLHTFGGTGLVTYEVQSPEGRQLYAGTSITNPGTLQAGKQAIVSLINNTVNSKIFENGTLIVSGNTGSGGVNSRQLSVGALTGSSRFTAVSASAIFIFSVVHDDATRKRIENWLSRQYGISVN